MAESMVISAVRSSAIENVKVELARCLRLLAVLFPDDDLVGNPPTLNIVDGYVPLREQAVTCGEAHQISLYTRGELSRSPDQILTILLHKAIHVANAFHWRSSHLAADTFEEFGLLGLV